MSRLALVRDSFADAFRNPRLWLLHLVANALLFALATMWLLMPVASIVQIVFNGVAALVLLAAALILHGGTLNYFYDRQANSSSKLFPALRRATLHFFAIMAALLAFYLLWLLVGKCESYSDTFPAYIRSTLPVAIRRHSTLPALDYLFATAIFCARWILAPGLILPLLLGAARQGFRVFAIGGVANWRKAFTSFTYWLMLSVAAIVGVFATEKIMSLTPDFKTSTFYGEAFSFAVRLFFAYVLAIWAWFLACSVVVRRASAVRHNDLARNSTA